MLNVFTVYDGLVLIRQLGSYRGKPTMEDVYIFVNLASYSYPDRQLTIQWNIQVAIAVQFDEDGLLIIQKIFPLRQLAT